MSLEGPVLICQNVTGAFQLPCTRCRRNLKRTEQLEPTAMPPVKLKSQSGDLQVL